MSTVLDIDLSTILEDLDFTVPCQVDETHAAEVMLVCRFCGFSAGMCRPHYAQTRAHAEKHLAAHPKNVIRCRACMREEHSHDALVEVVDL